MANVVLKTEEEQVAQAAQAARVASLPPVSTPASVEVVETSATAAVTPLAAASSSSSRRYDQATIEKALAVAMQMQQEHNATLSTEQVVRLGEEVNVDPAFMLRALAQIDGTAGGEATTSVAPPRQSTRATQTQARVQVSTSEQVQGLMPLPLVLRYMAVLVPLFFALVSLVIFNSPATRLDQNDNAFALVWMFLGGPLVALFLGYGFKRLRLGLLGGFCTGVFLLLAAIGASANPGRIPVGEFFVMLFLYATVGSLSGLTGAALPRLYRRTMIALVRQFPHLTEAEESR